MDHNMKNLLLSLTSDFRRHFEVEQAADFFRIYNINLEDLNLPEPDKPLCLRWFEALRATPMGNLTKPMIRVEGRYASQAFGVGGMGRARDGPIKYQYIQIDKNI